MNKIEVKKITISPLIIIIGIFVIPAILAIGTAYGATTIFSSNEVGFDNTRTNIQSTNVQGAIDELYSKATDYSSINTRVTALEDYKNQIYPIGSIYIGVNNTNPSTLFGGTWESFGEGRTLIGVDPNDSDFNIIEKTGGNKNHNHTLENGYARITIHSGGRIGLHYKGTQNWNETYGATVTSPGGISSSAGDAVTLGGTTDNTNSLQPYITVYMWKRTA